jgi:hypothetical protein
LVIHKKGGMTKRKKEAKKENVVRIWKTEGVFHIPATTNKQQVI